MLNLALALIRWYQIHISVHTGSHCRFTPTCSAYAYTALQRFGLWRGSWLAVRRIARCVPWNPGGYDPVPMN